MDQLYCIDIMTGDPYFAPLGTEWIEYVARWCVMEGVNRDFYAARDVQDGLEWVVKYAEVAREVCIKAWEEALEMERRMNTPIEPVVQEVVHKEVHTSKGTQVQFVCSSTPKEGVQEAFRTSLISTEASGHMRVILLSSTRPPKKMQVTTCFVLEVDATACGSMCLPQGVLTPKAIGSGKLFVPLNEALSKVVCDVQASSMCDLLRETLRDVPLHDDYGYVGLYREVSPGSPCASVWLVVNDHNDYVNLAMHRNVMYHMKNGHTWRVSFMEDESALILQSIAMDWREHLAMQFIRRISGSEDNLAEFVVPSDEEIASMCGSKTFTHPSHVQNTASFTEICRPGCSAFHVPHTSMQHITGSPSSLVYASDAHTLVADIPAVLELDSLHDGFLVYGIGNTHNVTSDCLGAVPTGGVVVENGPEVASSVAFCGIDSDIDPMYARRQTREGGFGVVEDYHWSGVNNHTVPHFLHPMSIFCGVGYSPRKMRDAVDTDDVRGILERLKLGGGSASRRIAQRSSPSTSGSGDIVHSSEDDQGNQ